RTVEAAVLAPARREVDLLDGAAVPVVQQRAQDRGVFKIVLFGVAEILQFHRPVAAIDLRLQQGAERRIAVEGGQAAPDHASARVDQRTEAAVADHAQVEIAHACLPMPACPSSSQRRTAFGPERPKCAALGSRAPTRMLTPCCALTTAKPLSSVMSSPANTGTRPWHGASRISAAIAMPLSLPAGRDPTTLWPWCRRNP